MKIMKLNIFKFIASVIIAFAIMLIISCSKDEVATPPPTPKKAIKIGDVFAGGTVFFVEPNGEHGLMTWASDLIPGGANFADAFTLCENFQSSTAGEPNPSTDWYLPSVAEIQKLYAQKTFIGGFKNDYYWTSTEDPNDTSVAYCVLFANAAGNANLASRTQKFNVRPIRKF